MKEDKIIEKAEVELKYLTGDAEVKRLAQLRERWLRDELRMKELVENTQKDLREGLKRIEIEKRKACKYSMEEGIKKGMEKGMKEGIEQACHRIAKKMLEKGISIYEIKEYTNLSEEEIIHLK